MTFKGGKKILPMCFGATTKKEKKNVRGGGLQPAPPKSILCERNNWVHCWLYLDDTLYAKLNHYILIRYDYCYDYGINMIILNNDDTDDDDNNINVCKSQHASQFLFLLFKTTELLQAYWFK